MRKEEKHVRYERNLPGTGRAACDTGGSGIANGGAKKKGPEADQEEKEPGSQRSDGGPGSVAAAECGPGSDHICAAGRADIKKSAYVGWGALGTQKRTQLYFIRKDGEMEELDRAIGLAVAEFRKEFGEDAKIEDGDEFVTVFNNCCLIISLLTKKLTTKFIGGKPYRVDTALSIYEEAEDENGKSDN